MVITMVESNKTFKIVSNIVMILLCLFCIFPFVLLFMSSVTDEQTLIHDGYTFFPKKFSLDAYKYLFSGTTKVLRGYLITVSVTVIGTICNLTLTTLMAYPLSRKDLPHRNFFSFMVFFTMLFNGGLVPSYIMWSQLFHIKNTMFALIIPNLMLNAFYIIMMRTYFTTNIPDAVIEAARIDGGGEFYILFKIVLPMSVPMIATLSMLVGLMYWNDWTNGLYYITDDKLFSIQNVLNRMLADIQFLKSNSSDLSSNVGQLPSIGIKMAVAVLGVLPIMAIYPFFQKYFIKGISVGAVKG